MNIFVVDSNFFIQAHRANYPLDVATSFWNKIKQLADDRRIISIDKVKEEIFANDDTLTNWCATNLPQSFFEETSGIISQYSRICAWASSRSDHYLPKALTEFLHADEADAWLVAYGLADINNRTIVTHEISSPYGKNRVKIPDVCLANNISFLNTIEMFRLLNETF